MLKVSVKNVQKGIYLMVLNGQIDEDTILTVQDEFNKLFQANHNKIICDMEKVEHISAPVLKSFLENITTARSRGGDIKIINIQTSLVGIMRYAGFNDTSAFCSSIKEATNALMQSTFGNNGVDDPFGSTLQTGGNDLYSPTIQRSQSPLLPKEGLYEATIQMGGSPLQGRSKKENTEDPYGATIQMGGSPLQSRSKKENTEDPYGETIQMGGSPLKKGSSQHKKDDPFDTTIQMPDSPLKNKSKIADEKTVQADESPLKSGSSSKRKASPPPPPPAQQTPVPAAPPQTTASTTPVVSKSAPTVPAPTKSTTPVTPAPPKSPIQHAEEQIVVETELKRKSTIRFYKRMYPFCIFPLKVLFSQQKIQKIVHKKIEQVEGKKDVVVSKEKPIVEVVPHFPGCLIVPSRKKVDVTPEISQANFSVTPLAESKNQKGYVEIYYNGEVIDTVEQLTYHVEKQTIAKFALYMSIISPVISTSLDAFQIDFNEKLPMAIEWLSKVTQLFGGKTGFGLALAGAFLFISLVSYLLKRPREANPIENVLPVE